MDIYKTQLHINYQKKKFDKPEREEEDFGDGKNQPLMANSPVLINFGKTTRSRGYSLASKALVPVGVEPRVEPLQNNPPENPSVLAVHGVLDRVFFWTKLALKLPW